MFLKSKNVYFEKFVALLAVWSCSDVAKVMTACVLCVCSVKGATVARIGLPVQASRSFT